MSKGPVLIELEDAQPRLGPGEAPPVPDPEVAGAGLPQGRAMQTVATLGARKPSRLGRWFWGLLLSLVATLATLAAFDVVSGLLERNVIVGYGVLGLMILLMIVLAMICLRELAVFSRLARMDSLHRAAETALAEEDLKAARQVSAGLVQLYAGREDTRWGRERLSDYSAEQFDAAAVLGLAETELLAPLDAAAMREVEAAARQVATVTAIVPLAFADVFAALTANLRMIRRIAEIYGGRSGTLGSWRLARAVMTHLVATGAVAVGDDLIGSVAGGSVLSKISRRFGEGVVNGALTARVGVAAMEVCRPLPFLRVARPSVTGLVKRALTGLFGQG
jgi:putative membrane protein